MNEPDGKADFITHLIEGNNAMVRDDIDAAIAAYHVAYALNPKFAMTCTKLGQAYYKKKDYDEAISYYKKALELDPKQTETLYRLGKAYGDSGMVIQAAVAFDLARERDTEGDLSERIDSSERRIRKSSSHSMRPASPIATLRDTASILFNHPATIISVFLSVFVFILASFAIRWALAAFDMPLPVVDFTKYLFADKAPPLSASTVIYLLGMLAVFCALCVPLLNVETALVGRLCAGREATFDEALSRSFGQASPLAAVTLVILFIAGFVAVASSLIFKSFQLMFYDFFRLSVPFKILVIPSTVLVMAHFLYIYPSIVLDRKKWENSLKQSITFASKHYWFTFIFLCCYIGAQFLVIHYSGDRITPKYIFAQFALIIAQAFFVAGITTAYAKAGRGRHKRRSGAKKKAADTEQPQPDESEEMIISEGHESEQEAGEDKGYVL
ncbi:MAG: tetratricopeptide repeat protein [bacterium]